MKGQRGEDHLVYLDRLVVRRLLLRLDAELADAGAVYEHQHISVEHVLPQNPAAESGWHVDFPDEDVREYWVHRLANLVLLSRRKNSTASNYDFAEKKEVYFNRGGTAPFAITTEVVSASAWSPVVLEQRQMRLVGVLARAWRLTGQVSG
jgi:hypothetical protein